MSPTFSGLVLSAMLVLTGGCRVGYPSANADLDSAPMDAGHREASARDGGPPSPDAGPPDLCPPTPEVCNGVDDDCDENIDEGFDLSNDADHCGACGVRCPEGANGTRTCTDGTCRLDCVDGFEDCDGDRDNGCEADLEATTTCGDCETVCAPPTPLCELGDGESCVVECSSGMTSCGESCVALRTSVTNCGACGVLCPTRANATAGCEMGICTSTCEDNYGDCDGDETNGCETLLRTNSDCGACDVACSLPNAFASCTTGTCEFVRCGLAFGDCDDDESNGCEEIIESVSFVDRDRDGFGDPVIPPAYICPMDLASMAWTDNAGDCDDSDPRAFPGQTEFFTGERVGGGFDYDCNGAEELFATDTAVCISGDTCLLGRDGWLGSTVAPCGTTREYMVDCDGGEPICDLSIAFRPQRCR